jgi:hypothetical protein
MRQSSDDLLHGVIDEYSFQEWPGDGLEITDLGCAKRDTRHRVSSGSGKNYASIPASAYLFSDSISEK